MTRLTVLILILLFGTGGSSSDPCPSGTYRSRFMSKCVECSAGTKPNSKQTACEDCPRGTYKDRGMSECDRCKANATSRGGVRVCTPCPAGEMANYDRTRCDGCRPGTYRGTSMLKCEPCPLDKFSGGYGRAKCTSCKEGMTPNEYKRQCVKCPKGTYRDKTMLMCTECPWGSIPNGWQAGCVHCRRGSYRNHTMDKCVACPLQTISNPWQSACDGDKYYWKWSAVKRNAMIDFDPRSSLDIRTDSTPTPAYVKVGFYDKTNSSVGAVHIGLFEDPVYYFVPCSQAYTKFPVKSPSTRDKTWRITITQAKWHIWLMIYCNEVEVLSIYFHSRNCYNESYSFYRMKSITQLKFSGEDTASDYYRFFKNDVIPEDGNPCPDNAYHCASGECWVKQEIEAGVYAHGSSYGITPCLCIIDGKGKEADYLRNNTIFDPKFFNSKEDGPLLGVQFIQCKEKGSDDMALHKETEVTCGWFFEDRNDWNFLIRRKNYWGYGRNSGLQHVGTPHDCSGSNTWKIILIVLSSVAFVLIFMVSIWKLRKKGLCRGYRNSRTHRAIPSDMVTRHVNPTREPQAQHEPTVSESETPPQSPSNPTILRTASIPTYRECLEASDRIVTENDYVTLPTIEPSAPPFNDGTLEELPPTYEDVQEHQDLYAVAEVEQQNAAHPSRTAGPTRTTIFSDGFGARNGT